jgi:hypothetical protein
MREELICKLFLDARSIFNSNILGISIFIKAEYFKMRINRACRTIFYHLLDMRLIQGN